MKPRARRRKLDAWIRRPFLRLPRELAACLILTAAPLPPGALPGRRFAAAILLTATLATVAHLLKAVTPQGAVAGAMVSLLLFLGGGLGAFAGLTSVFLLTWISTRLGYERKHRLGLAESRQGRSAGQVLANTGVAALLAAAAPFSSLPSLWLAAAAAALAEAAADTVSSELGQAAAGPTYLLTSLRAVPPGTNGGVSLPGTLAGGLAAGLVAATLAAFGMISFTQAAAVTLAAVAGMFVDSLLGAAAEPRSLLNNNGVNLAGTLVAAGVALVICNL